ncbi:MAG TPA: terminase small subunit [Pyrinomonadaceae bacterium]|jgi:phage terminase small subunit
MSDEREEIKLTPKQKLFADYYLHEAHFNGTKAAELAEYKGNRATLAAVAYENLRKPQIKTYIDERLSAMTMPSNVVLATLTEYAEGNIEDVCDEHGNFSFELAKKRRKTHLIKKLKVKRSIKQRKTEVREDMRGFLAEDEIEDLQSDVEILHEEVEFELYSAHEARRDLGKYHKLFTEKHEHTGAGGEPLFPKVYAGFDPSKV